MPPSGWSPISVGPKPMGHCGSSTQKPAPPPGPCQGWGASPGIGLANWAVAGGADDVRAVRAAAVAAGGSLVLLAGPADLRRDAGAWGTPPATLHLMRRLRSAFDPNNVINPGRFVV